MSSLIEQFSVVRKIARSGIGRRGIGCIGGMERSDGTERSGMRRSDRGRSGGMGRSGMGS